MIPFEPQAPIFRFKQDLADPADLQGVVRIRWGRPDRRGLFTYYTRLDQALLLWSGAIALIFVTAQFVPLDWKTQAIAWSALSLATTIITSWLAWAWATAKQCRWILGVWCLLMVGGLCLTNYGVFMVQSTLLMHLCTLWLGISGLGYLVSGWGMQSQALTLTGITHWLLVPLLTVLPTWQFLLTGVFMAGNLWILAEFQWDHR